MSLAHATKWRIRDRAIPLGPVPLLMAVVNLTPDSFSEKSRFAKGLNDSPEQFQVDAEAAVNYALEMVQAGAAVIDLGAESTAPGSEPVCDQEQIRRLIPTLRQLAEQTTCPLSVDTTSSVVARAALEAGADIINDVSGGTFDPEMIEVVRYYHAGVCLGHIQGQPSTMQINPVYHDVLVEVAQELTLRRQAFLRAGIPGDAIAIDPGIGFGKNYEHNLAILRQPEMFRIENSPLLIGHSRKRFLRTFCTVSSPSIELLDSLTACVSAWLAQRGIDLLRVHRIDLNRDAVALARELIS